MDAIKIDIRPHRRYNFNHDLDIDWLGLDAGEPEAEKYYDSLDDDYYCYMLDFFEHGAISFSLVIDRTNIWYYEFDRSRNVGLIAIPKSMIKIWINPVELARDYLHDYNYEINGRDLEDE